MVFFRLVFRVDYRHLYSDKGISYGAASFGHSISSTLTIPSKDCYGTPCPSRFVLTGNAIVPERSARAIQRRRLAWNGLSIVSPMNKSCSASPKLLQPQTTGGTYQAEKSAVAIRELLCRRQHEVPIPGEILLIARIRKKIE
jgi:hypothetical protein